MDYSLVVVRMIYHVVQPMPVTLAQVHAQPALNLSALAIHVIHAIHVVQMQVMHMVVGINPALH